MLDAAVELAQSEDVSLMLIASRRQVDAQQFGGGYVDGLTPEALVGRVRDRDRRQRVLVCRDHGGPWQGASGLQASANQAMTDARDSFGADIDAIRLAYTQSHVTVAYLKRRFGTTRFTTMLRAVGGGEAPEAALRRTYRYSYKTLKLAVDNFIGRG